MAADQREGPTPVSLDVSVEPAKEPFAGKRPRGRPRRGGLSTKRQEFVNQMGMGLTPRAAARQAGYSGFENEANRLLKTPGVLDAVLRALQKTAAKWSHVRALAMNALMDTLSLREWKCDCGGEGVCKTCGKVIFYPTADPKTRTAAAVGALGLLSKIGDGKSLGDRADAEDSPLSAAEATARVLGQAAAEVGGKIVIMIPPEGKAN